MAKINKLQKSGVTIYPATIPQAVIDSETGKTQKEVNDDVVEVAKTLKQVEDNAVMRLINSITNGNFVNGTTGWKKTLNVIWSVENNQLNVAYNSTSYSIELAMPLSVTVNDKLYISLKAKSTDDVTIRFRGDGVNIIADIPLTTVLKTYSYIVSALTNSYIGRLIALSGDFASNTVSYKDFIVCNLTEVFGAGNEPTKEEMDLLISILGIEYFEGEITIPVQKIMQWQLKLIRKNKNAIIALGGTII